MQNGFSLEIALRLIMIMAPRPHTHVMLGAVSGLISSQGLAAEHWNTSVT